MLETDGTSIGLSVGKCRHAQIKKIGLKVEKALPCNCDDDSDFEDTLGSFCGGDFGFETSKAQIGEANTTKGTLVVNVKGLNEDDSIKVVLRNMQNQVIK